MGKAFGKRKNREIVLWAMLICFVLICLFPATVFAQQEEPRKIRVGYPIQSGFTEIDETGHYSGYTYDYLQEIAQYTGWEYEFVQLDGDLNDVLTQMLDMLQTGELDLMGAMTFSDDMAQIYDYPGYSYGTAYTTLSVLKGNTEINETNFQSMGHIRVALPETSKKRSADLERFCEMNGLTPKLVFCANDEEQIAALEEGRADAMLGVDVSPVPGTRTIAKFGAQPYYFATTKGNTDIVTELNTAILKINEADPYFATTLYESYFGNKDDTLILSDEELNYIRQAGTIRVGALTERAPLQYLDSQAGQMKGVSIDILDYISQQTGLAFEVEPVEDYESLIQKIDRGELDAVAGISADNETAETYGVALTRPYLEAQIVMLVHQGVDARALSGKKLALPEGFIYSGNYVGNVVWYPSPQACMEAVIRGEADYTYGNAYIVQYYVNQMPSTGVQLLPQSTSISSQAIGVTRPADINLITIINKVIRSMPTEAMQTLINRNTISPPRQITWASYIDSNPREAMLLVVVLAGVAVVFLALYFSRRMKLDRRIALENERYQQLFQLSNEYIFEYDFNSDTLTLSERSAEYFGVPRENKHYRTSLQEEDNPENRILLGLLQKATDQESFAEEVSFQMADGTERHLRVAAKVIHDNKGKQMTTIGKIADVQKEWTEKNELMEKAQKDSLTGVYNAATSRELVGAYLEENKGDAAGALIIIDIDHFKAINDQYGHYEGDRVLAETARILQDVFRKDDIVGRLGGDEFTVFMKGVRRSDSVLDKCKQLQQQLAWKIVPNGKMGITVSIGAVMVKPGLGFNRLYVMADQALYRVKEDGRNGVEIA